MLENFVEFKVLRFYYRLFNLLWYSDFFIELPLFQQVLLLFILFWTVCGVNGLVFSVIIPGSAWLILAVGHFLLLKVFPSLSERWQKMVAMWDRPPDAPPAPPLLTQAAPEASTTGAQRHQYKLTKIFTNFSLGMPLLYYFSSSFLGWVFTRATDTVVHMILIWILVVVLNMSNTVVDFFVCMPVKYLNVTSGNVTADVWCPTPYFNDSYVEKLVSEDSVKKFRENYGFTSYVTRVIDFVSGASCKGTKAAVGGGAIGWVISTTFCTVFTAFVTVYVYFDVVSGVFHFIDSAISRTFGRDYAYFWFRPTISSFLVVQAITLSYKVISTLILLLGTFALGFDFVSGLIRMEWCCTGMCVRRDFRELCDGFWGVIIARWCYDWWYGLTVHTEMASEFRTKLARAKDEFATCPFFKPLMRNENFRRHVTRETRKFLVSFLSQYKLIEREVGGETWVQLPAGTRIKQRLDDRFSFSPRTKFVDRSQSSPRLCIRRDSVVDRVPGAPVVLCFMSLKQKGRTQEEGLKSRDIEIPAFDLSFLEFPVPRASGCYESVVFPLDDAAYRPDKFEFGQQEFGYLVSGRPAGRQEANIFDDYGDEENGEVMGAVVEDYEEEADQEKEFEPDPSPVVPEVEDYVRDDGLTEAEAAELDRLSRKKDVEKQKKTEEAAALLKSLGFAVSSKPASRAATPRREVEKTTSEVTTAKTSRAPSAEKPPASSKTSRASSVDRKSESSPATKTESAAAASSTPASNSTTNNNNGNTTAATPPASTTSSAPAKTQQTPKAPASAPPAKKTAQTPAAKPSGKKSSSGNTAVTCNLRLRDGQGITLSPQSENECWAMCLAVALVELSKQPDFKINDSTSEVLRKIYNCEVRYITRELVPYIIQFTSKHHPSAADDAGFDFKKCADTFRKHHYISTRKKEKLRLDTILKFGKHNPTHITPFCLAELYRPLDKEDPVAVARVAANKFVGTKSHWTAFTGNSAAWTSAEFPAFSRNAYKGMPVERVVVWCAKKRPEKRDDAPPADGAEAAPRPDADAPAAANDNDEAQAPPAVQTPAPAAPVKLTFTDPDSNANASSTKKIENPTDKDLETAEAATPLEITDDALFSCRTGYCPVRDGAKGTLPSQAHSLGRTKEGIQETSCDVAQHLSSNIVPSTQGSHGPRQLGQGEAGTSTVPSHQRDSSQSRRTIDLGSQALASPNLLPRNEPTPWGVQQSQQVREGRDRLEVVSQRIDNLEGGQEELRNSLHQTPTGSSIGGKVGGHPTRNLQFSNGGYSNVHPSSMGFGSSQGGRLSTSQGRHQVLQHNDWSTHHHRSSWQGRQGAQGQVHSPNSHPQGLHPSSLQFPLQGAQRPLPLPSLAPQQQRNQRNPPFRQPVSQLPFSSSWGSSSNGRFWSPSQGNHDPHGSQVGGHSQTLPGLGSPQSRRSQQMSKGSSKPLERSQKTASNLGYTFEDARKGFMASTHEIIAAAKVSPSAVASATLSSSSPSSSTTTTPSPSTASSSPSASSGWPPSSPSPPKVPVHLFKHATNVDFDALEKLSSHSGTTLENLLLARRYMTDAEMYLPHLPKRTVRDVVTARDFTPEDTAKFLECNNVEEVLPSEVKGRVLVFPHLEFPPTGARKRVINNTDDVNKNVPAAPKVGFRNVPKLRCLVWKGTYMIEIDLKSYYHQFLLSKEVGEIFCFRLPTEGGGSILVRLKAAPTGLSHMVFVGVSVTDRLTDIELGTATLDTHIDNIAVFDSSREGCIELIKIIAERAKMCGITIKDDLSDIPAKVKTEHTYCGIAYDLVNKTVAVPEKTLTKIRLSLSLMDRWTVRSFAQHFGLLNYAAQIIDVPRCNYFNLYRFISATACRMHESNHQQWDTPIEIWPSALAELKHWTEVVLENTPCYVPEPTPPNLLMAVDACATGWGYVALDEVTGEMWKFGATWDNRFVSKYGRLLQRSTFTEPWGIFLAKSHIMSKISGSRHFLVGTDNVASKYTFNRRYNSRSYHLNAVAKRDYDSFPQLQATYIHIAGSKNFIADELSRQGFSNKIVNKDMMGFTRDDLRQLLGVKTLAEATSSTSDNR